MGKALSLTKDQKNDLLEGLAFLSRIFWGPTPEICREVAQKTPFEWFASLSHLQEPSLARHMRELDSFVGKIPDEEVLWGLLEEEYLRLFINAKEGIVAPLYESCYAYEGASLMGPSAVMMRERLESKGLSVSDDLREPPDHLSVELEYLYFLLKKGWSDPDPTVLGEASSFACETVLPWADEVNHRLASRDERGFYSHVTALLCSLLGFIATIGSTQGAVD